jgi:hypothetical protein
MHTCLLRATIFRKQRTWPTAGKGGEKHYQAYLYTLKLAHEGRRAVFLIPLQQDTKVFGV